MLIAKEQHLQPGSILPAFQVPTQGSGALPPSHPALQPQQVPEGPKMLEWEAGFSKKQSSAGTFLSPACDNRQPLPRGFGWPCPGAPACRDANVAPDITPPEGMAGWRGSVCGSPGASLPFRQSGEGSRRDMNLLPPPR